jgi:inhibitor of KinA
MTILPLGDRALTITLGTEVDDATLQRVRLLAQFLNDRKPASIVDVVPAYTTVTVFYEGGCGLLDESSPLEQARLFAEDCCARVEKELSEKHPREIQPPRMLKIPVCYGGNYGPDLAVVAAHTGLAVEDVIAQHAGATYDVAAVGFVPGFPYLRGLPRALHTPRRATPRTKVAVGSVGIGGSQTGIYPLSTPGGWQLIGRTPVTLFEVSRPHPALLRVGDRVAFVPVTEAEFSTWRLP